MDSTSAEQRLARAEDLRAQLQGPNAAGAGEDFTAEYSQMVGALEYFIENQRNEQAMRMAIALSRYWLTNGEFIEGDRWFDQVLVLPGGDVLLRGRAKVMAGFMPFWMGEDDKAARLFDDALRIGRQVDDSAVISQALGGLARVALRTDVSRARELALEAFDVSDAAGDVGGVSNALHLLGVGAQMAGDLSDARRWMTQRLNLERDNGNGFLAASEACNLSMVERQLGNLDVAEELAREALTISVRIGGDFITPFAIAGLASIAAQRGDNQRAGILIGAAEGMLDAMEMAWPPDEAPHHDRLIVELPAAMGSDAFEAARTRGREQPDAVSVEYALGVG